MNQVSAIEYCSRKIAALARSLLSSKAAWNGLSWDCSRGSSSLAGGSSLSRILPVSQELQGDSESRRGERVRMLSPRQTFNDLSTSECIPGMGSQMREGVTWSRLEKLDRVRFHESQVVSNAEQRLERPDRWRNKHIHKLLCLFQFDTSQ